jgi:AcrR family transcriptional regulator
MSVVTPATAPSARIRQRRSRKTYDAIIRTAFKLLEQREFDEMSIEELARKAGYSVGAFYARFKSKTELFDAMVAHHIEERRIARRELFANEPDATLIKELIRRTVQYYWTRRRFWRAALFRSIGDPDFWEPLRKLGHEFADGVIARITARTNRPLTENEETNVRFAVQLVLGLINNTLINQPGPVLMGQELFVDNITRAFVLVSGYDELLAAPRRSKRAKKKSRA